MVVDGWKFSKTYDYFTISIHNTVHKMLMRFQFYELFFIEKLCRLMPRYNNDVGKLRIFHLNSTTMEGLDNLYQINQRIEELQQRVLVLMYTDGERCINFNMDALKHVGNIRVELDNLLRARFHSVKGCYSPKTIALNQLNP
ncbi:unnamed protein product [Rotaria socialis]